MSDVFFAYLPSKEIVDFKGIYSYDIGIIFPNGTLMTKEALPKRQGAQRIQVDFENLRGWNAEWLVGYRKRFSEDAESFLIETPPHMPVEIWASNADWKQDYYYNFRERRGIELLDSMTLVPNAYGYLPDWLPVRQAAITAWKPYQSVQDLAFFCHPFVESVTVDPEAEEIGSGSFCACPRLREVEIGEKAFLNAGMSGCFCDNPVLSVFRIVLCENSQLTEAVYPNEKDLRWCGGTGLWFRNCPNLTHLVIAGTERTIRIAYDQS